MPSEIISKAVVRPAHRFLMQEMVYAVCFNLDKSTTALYFADIALLLVVIGRLKGNSIVIIKHNLDMVKTADYIVS